MKVWPPLTLANLKGEFMPSHSFQSHMDEILKVYPQFYQMSKADDEMAFGILESEQMKLGDKTEIIYSRRPDLKGSFEESMQNPLMVLGEEQSFFGVLSEMQAYHQGKSYEHFYTSDLRIAQNAVKSVKFGFRPYYKDMIKLMDRKCFTVVLKENIRALKALTTGKSGINYSPYIPYYTTSIPVTTGLKIQAKINLDKSYNLKKTDEFPIDLFTSLTSDLDYCHKEHKDGDNFLIKKDNEVIGLISLYRPKKRSLKIKTFSKGLNLMMKSIKAFTGFDYNEKIPWVYCTQFLVKTGLDKNSVLTEVIKLLTKNKSVLAGELLLLCRVGENVEKLSLWSAQIDTQGVVYQVAIKGDNTLSETTNAYLNPLCL